jgi:D-arabinose 1-dehydrogenase-like Zn-dependent alcohol dehydrogenase
VQALVFKSGRPEVREVPLPRPARGFALVGVLLSGICNTDLGLLISAQFPLTRARQALAAAAGRGARKILLRPDPRR